MNVETQIVLSDGRRVAVCEADAGDMLDVIEMAGGAAMSDTWMQYALTICSVRAINAIPVRFPTSKDGLRELARQVGTVGLNEIAEQLFGAAQAPLTSHAQDNDAELAAKN